ncbi:acyltransferase ChoActase/COT/CPT [Gloeopeniophorella convolvens]|nr:acyltransferase ChoActase/COT/CPT [Gloeopeniophorella convolvens]
MATVSYIPSRPPAPRLPVPDLHKTLSRYLQSLLPLLHEQEARGGPPVQSALQTRQQWADDFEKGVGAKCQDRLLALDRASPVNWLDDLWLKKAYLEWRLPLLIHSNWWLAFVNDDRVPEHILRDPYSSALKPLGINPWQGCYSTTGNNPNTDRTAVWLQETVAIMYGTSRVPQRGCDTLSLQPPLGSPNARKIVVLVNDWLYAVDVYGAGGALFSVGEIEQRLRGVVADAGHRVAVGEKPVPVGLLSADDRDRWAENLQHLLSLSEANRVIFAVALDSHTLGSEPSTPIPIDSPAEIDTHLHNIRSSKDAHNRWFDKVYTIIVESNTRAGAMGEHSPCEALVPSAVAEYAVVQSIVPESFPEPEPAPFSPEPNACTSIGGWERLDWVTDARIAAECAGAEARAKALIADSDDGALWFFDYGADWITSAAGLSPDAWVQMALQLAWYRTRGVFTATYETALTRVFDKGRTETIRVLSADSRAWVLAMADPFASAATKFALLRRAEKTHVALTRQAMTGRGVDRHLLGLRHMLRAGERAALLEDPLFARGQEWKLSTSGLSATSNFRGTGFGAPYHDGYGINYIVTSHDIRFSIESKYSCPETDTAAFQRAIATALHDMELICPSEEPPPPARL